MQTETTPAQADVSELDLVRQCQAGQTEAFDQLVTRYWTRVFAMIYNMVQHERRVGPVAQERYQKLEIERALSRESIVLYLDLSDRHERDHRLAAQTANQSRRGRVR